MTADHDVHAVVLAVEDAAGAIREWVDDAGRLGVGALLDVADELVAALELLGPCGRVAAGRARHRANVTDLVMASAAPWREGDHQPAVAPLTGSPGPAPAGLVQPASPSGGRAFPPTPPGDPPSGPP